MNPGKAFVSAWSAEEDETLRGVFLSPPEALRAALPNRTLGAIRSRITRLNLRGSRGLVPLSKACRQAGYDPRGLLRLLERHAVPVVRPQGQGAGFPAYVEWCAVHNAVVADLGAGHIL